MSVQAATAHWESLFQAPDDLKQLLKALDLSKGFNFYLALCNAPRLAETALQILERHLNSDRGSLRHVVRLDPYRVDARLEEAVSEEVLGSTVLKRLVEPRPEDATPGAIHVVDASRAIQSDDGVWKKLFERMNEQRNTIMEALGGALVMVLPPRLEDDLEATAPDWWSIRSSDYDLTGRADVGGGFQREVEPRDAGRRRVFSAPRPGWREHLDASRARARAAEIRYEHESSKESRRTLASAYKSIAVLDAEGATELLAEARSHQEQFKRTEALELLDEAVENRRNVIRLCSGPPSSRGEASPVDPDQANDDLAVTLVYRGGALYEDGNLGDAARDAAEAIRILRDLLALHPDHEEWLHDLGDALSLGGDVALGTSNIDEAVRMYEEGQTIWARLVERRPERMDYLRALSLSLDRVGDARFAEGKLSDAVGVYFEGLKISFRLLEGDPRESELWHNVSTLLDHLGDLHLKRGDIDRAQMHYEEQARISERNPDRDERLRDLSVAEINLGDVSRARGDLDAAIAAYGAALKSRRYLLTFDSQRPEWRRDVFVALERLGAAHFFRGDFSRAFLAYTEAISIMRELSQRYPSRAEWRRELRTALGRLAEIHRARGEEKHARACEEESRALA